MGDASSACKLAVIADSYMANCAYLTRKDAVITGGYAAADADMRHNEAVFAQYIIMAEMYKVINFGTGTYNRASCGSPVDTGIAADFPAVALSIQELLPISTSSSSTTLPACKTKLCLPVFLSVI